MEAGQRAGQCAVMVTSVIVSRLDRLRKSRSALCGLVRWLSHASVLSTAPKTLLPLRKKRGTHKFCAVTSEWRVPLDRKVGIAQAGV